MGYHLYQLPAAFAAVQRAIDDLDDGELPPELISELERLECNWDEKVDGICGLYQELIHASESAWEECERLRDLSVSRQKRADQLRAYLQHCMEQRGIKTTETEKFKVGIRANSVSTVVCNVPIEQVPDDLKKVKTTVDIDKQRILQEFRLSGTVPAGFEIVQGTHLRIS